MRTPLIPRALVVAGVLLSSACSIDVHGRGVSVSEEKTFAVSGPANLSLLTFDGAIEVRSWDRNEVAVEIIRRANTMEEAEALKVRTSQEGNRILIDARDEESRRGSVHIGTWVSPSVSLIVRAPRTVTLNAESGDGAITVEQLSGPLTLRTGDGAIRGSALEGMIKAHTGDGSIAVDSSAGQFDLDTGDGSIRLSARIDELSVHTGDGSVSVDAETGSAMKSDWSVTTGDGSVRLGLPEGFSGEIDAESGDGRVHADWIPHDEPLDEDDRRRLRGRLGTGGKSLRVRTGDGSITLTRR